MFFALYKFDILIQMSKQDEKDDKKDLIQMAKQDLIQMAKQDEKDEGESDGPLDKPSLLSLQNTAIKVRGGVLKLK